MKNIPVNRWTILVVLVITALGGGDLVTRLLSAVMALGGANAPAV